MAEGTSNTEADVKQGLTPERSLRKDINNAFSGIKGGFTSPRPETNRGIGLENEKPDLLDCDKWSRELEAIKPDNDYSYSDKSVTKAKNLMSRLFENKSILDESFKNGDFKDIEISIGILGRVLHSVLLSTIDSEMLTHTRNIILFGRDTVVNNIGNLDKLMENADVFPQFRKSVFQTVQSLFRSTMVVDQDKRIPVGFKMKHFEKIAEDMVKQRGGLSVSIDNSFITDCMVDLLYSSSEEEIVLVQPFIEKLFVDPNSKLRQYYYYNFFNALRSGPRWDYSGDIVRGVVRNFLSSQVGEVNMGKIIGNWRQAWLIKNSGEDGEALYRNLSYLYDLEDIRPGIGQVLFEQFGISDFGRYPQELLIAQYDERNKKDDVPYGVIINPVSDHNGALYGNTKTFQELYDQIKDRYRIKVWEVKNLLELVHSINNSRHRYGPISFAIIGGHGTEESIEFGGEFGEENEKLLKKNLEMKGAGSIKLAFAQNPTIILNSCSTGALGGIGQEISSMGAKVIAPPDPISISGIESSIDLNGKIEFRVKYDGNSVSPQIYKEGVLQK